MRPMNVPSIITPYVLSSAGIFGRANPGGIEEPELIVASISYKKGKLEVGYAKGPGRLGVQGMPVGRAHSRGRHVSSMAGHLYDIRVPVRMGDFYGHHEHPQRPRSFFGRRPIL